MELMCVIGAAMHLGYKSQLQLYKLTNDGWLNEHVHVLSGQRLLDVEAAVCYAGSSTRRTKRSHQFIDELQLTRSISNQGYGHQVEITPPPAGFFIAY